VSTLVLWESIFTFYSILILISKIVENISNIFFINLKIKIKAFKAEIPNFFITIGKSIAIIFIYQS